MRDPTATPMRRFGLRNNDRTRAVRREKFVSRPAEDGRTLDICSLGSSALLRRRAHHIDRQVLRENLGEMVVEAHAEHLADIADEMLFTLALFATISMRSHPYWMCR